jgi:peptidoglycan hydrolase-like protein with peptidoglycan-binding domain
VKISTAHVIPLALMVTGVGTMLLVVRKQKPALPSLPALLPKKASASSAATGTSTIQQGSSGPAVTKWQTFLGISADGQFGPATKAATQAWQSAHGLTADGVVGPQTWAASGVQ